MTRIAKSTLEELPMRSTRLIALSAAALIALAACSGAASTPAPTTAPTTAPTAAATTAPTTAASAPAASTGGGAGQAVSIKNFAFAPPTTTAKVGEQVTWTNGDSTAHTVTFDDASLTSSGNVQGGGTFSQTFAKAGTFTYHCSIHPTMKGTVTVS
jgi:plastocyanin